MFATLTYVATLLMPLLFSTMVIIWSVPLLLFAMLGWTVYKVPATRMRKIFPLIKLSSINDDADPIGWILGFWFIGYIYKVSGERNETIELYVFLNKKAYNKIFKDEEDVSSKEKSIKFWEREGEFFRLKYSGRSLETPPHEMYDSQLKSVALMLSTFQTKNNCVALLSGPAGSGKSCIPNFLAKELLKTKKAAHLVDTFSPITPGDAFVSLYNKVNPTKDEPLILVLEEVDGIIMKFHETSIPDHKFLPIMIQNKTGWNMFFDRFDRKLYPHVFVIMTTNKSIDFFDDLDPSYMREGRVDHKFEITKK